MAIALILAAGRGERFGASRPKALVELGGLPLLRWSTDLMLGLSEVDRVIVALPAGAAPAGTVGTAGTVGAAGTAGTAGTVGAVGVEGGAVRSESVARALTAAGPGDAGEAIIVHDAARPLVSAGLVRSAFATLAADDTLDAAIAAAPVSDTIKRARARVSEGQGEGMASGGAIVAETLDRSTLWAVQTPQVFRRAALERALDVPAEVLAQATDDAWLVERLGGRVAIVPSGRENLKITTPLDLALAELLIAQRG